MNTIFQKIKEKFCNINIKYYTDFNMLFIRCIDLTKQLSDIKTILKILIFEIQSQRMSKDTIIIEIIDKDFFSNDIFNLFNIIKLTKTSHYFNILVKKKIYSEEEINNRIKFINNNYIGLNINKDIAKNKNSCHNTITKHGE